MNTQNIVIIAALILAALWFINNKSTVSNGGNGSNDNQDDRGNPAKPDVVSAIDFQPEIIAVEDQSISRAIPKPSRGGSGSRTRSGSKVLSPDIQFHKR